MLINIHLHWTRASSSLSGLPSLLLTVYSVPASGLSQERSKHEELNGFQLSKAPLRPKSLLSGTLTKILKDHIFRHWIPCTSLTFFFNIFSHCILFLILHLIFPCLPRLQLLAHPNLIS